MKNRKTLSEWLSNRYLLILRNEENFAERTTFSFTYAKGILFLVVVFLLMLIISLYLVTTLLKTTLDPRYAEVEANRQVIELSMAVDSLATEVERKNNFIRSMQLVISGDVENDSVLNRDNTVPVENTTTDNEDMYSMAEVDSALRAEFEGTGLDDRLLLSNSMSEMQELFFVSPLSGGTVSARFDNKIEHFGVDLVAKPDEPVKVAADGTILFTNWTLKDGYVIAVQHRANVVTLYKHNSALLKKTGDYVRAGEIIAIIGNTGELTTGPHLHFEVWYNGNPVNAEEFVSF